MIDIHSHVLPCIDDGAQSIQEAMGLLKMLKAQGADKVIATPHFSNHNLSVDAFCQKRADSVDRLSEALANQPAESLPRLFLASEVLLTNDVASLKDLSRLCMPDNKHILIELPMLTWSSWVYHELFKIQGLHMLTPIIAHVDRYLIEQTDEHIEKLFALGFPIQFNLSVFSDKRLNKKMLKFYKKYPESFQHIGSDCHSTQSRPPEINKYYPVLIKKLGKKQVDYIFECSDKLLQ